jgi:hypothetical protein
VVDAFDQSGAKTVKTIALEDGGAIVILDWGSQPATFCNLLRVAATGRIGWTATPKHPLEGVWVDAHLQDGRLNANNWNGFVDIIDLETECIVSRSFAK